MRRQVEGYNGNHAIELLDTLLYKDGKTSDLLQSNYELERHLNNWLIPEIARRKEELERLRQKLQPFKTPTRHTCGSIKWGDLHRTTPISPEWGADRGRCIDRYYIEQFLEANANDIHSSVLEVHDDDYTIQFGGERVKHSDVIDIDPTNPRVTIIADLCRASVIPAHTYDCFIVTQTLHVIYDMRAVLGECVRILKPGGVLLATLPCVSKIAHEQGLDADFWRFTEAATRELFGEYFPSDRLVVHSYGNVLVTAAYLYGLACGELDPAEFEVHDPASPLLVSVRAQNFDAGLSSAGQPLK